LSKSSNVSEDGWWMTVMMVLHPSVSLRTEAITWYAAASRAPGVGSSRKRRVGEVTSSHPMATRRRWPPENPAKMPVADVGVSNTLQT
jgi:hypothetical protein